MTVMFVVIAVLGILSLLGILAFDNNVTARLHPRTDTIAERRDHAPSRRPAIHYPTLGYPALAGALAVALCGITGALVAMTTHTHWAPLLAGILVGALGFAAVAVLTPRQQRERPATLTIAGSRAAVIVDIPEGGSGEVDLTDIDGSTQRRSAVLASLTASAAAGETVLVIGTDGDRLIVQSA